MFARRYISVRTRLLVIGAALLLLLALSLILLGFWNLSQVRDQAIQDSSDALTEQGEVYLLRLAQERAQRIDRTLVTMEYLVQTVQQFTEQSSDTAFISIDDLFFQKVRDGLRYAYRGTTLWLLDDDLVEYPMVVDEFDRLFPNLATTVPEIHRISYLSDASMLQTFPTLDPIKTYPDAINDYRKLAQDLATNRDATKHAWSDIRLSIDETENVIVTASRVDHPHAMTRGTIIAEASLSALSVALEELPIATSSFGFLVNQKGFLIATTRVGQRVLVGRDMLVREAGTIHLPTEHHILTDLVERMTLTSGVTTTLIRGQSYLIAHAPIREANLGLGLAVSLDELTASRTATVSAINDLTQKLGVWGIVAALLVIGSLSLISGVLLDTWLVQPLVRLTQMTQTIASGSLQKVPASARQDELGDLARSFNTMIEALQQAQIQTEISQSALEAANRNLEQVVAERTDALNQALMEVQDAHLRLQQVMHARANAVRAVVHDLTHTVQGIQSALDCWLLDLQEQDGSQEVSGPGLRYLHAAIEQQRTLLEEMRDAALLESGTLVLRPEVTDMVVLVRQAVEQLQPRYDIAGCELLLSVTTQETKVWCDPRRIQRVVHNILDNALRYTSAYRNDGVVHVTVSRQNGEVKCEVQDNGRGIDREDLEVLGQKFTRLVRGEGDPDGMGLGLNFCIGIMRLSEGTLHITSPGKGFGTTVTACLPGAEKNEKGEHHE